MEKVENGLASITARDISNSLKDDFLKVIGRQKMKIKDAMTVFMEASVLYPDTIPELLTKVNAYSIMAKRNDYSDKDKIAIFDLDTQYRQLTDAMRNAKNETVKKDFENRRDKVVEQKKLITNKYA